jgi:frataxin-like iron-binding protein CyaY
MGEAALSQSRWLLPKRSHNMRRVVPRVALRASRSMYLRASLPSLVRPLALRHSPCGQHFHAPLCTATVPPAKVEVARILAAFTVGQATLAEISAKDTFNPTIGDDGVLWLDLGDKGYYSLQAQPDGQLLLFSPITGPLYYKHDPENKWWANPNDGHLMVELLVRELMHITSVYIDL